MNNTAGSCVLPAVTDDKHAARRCAEPVNEAVLLDSTADYIFAELRQNHFEAGSVVFDMVQFLVQRVADLRHHGVQTMAQALRELLGDQYLDFLKKMTDYSDGNEEFDSWHCVDGIAKLLAYADSDDKEALFSRFECVHALLDAVPCTALQLRKYAKSADFKQMWRIFMREWERQLEKKQSTEQT